MNQFNFVEPERSPDRSMVAEKIDTLPQMTGSILEGARSTKERRYNECTLKGKITHTVKVKPLW